MVVVDQIDAGGTVLTLPHTVVDVDVAVLARPPLLALAAVVPYGVLARECVYTRLSPAFVYVCTGMSIRTNSKIVMRNLRVKIRSWDKLFAFVYDCKGMFMRNKFYDCEEKLKSKFRFWEGLGFEP